MQASQQNGLGETYLASVQHRFQEYKALGDKTFLQLPEAGFHFAPAGSNSIALIIQHLAGNMKSRWTCFLTEDGEKPWRTRDAEFEETNLSQDGLVALWAEGWAVLFAALRSLTPDDLLKTIRIRSQPLTAIDAINRQLLHYGGHIGQLVFFRQAILRQHVANAFHSKKWHGRLQSILKLPCLNFFKSPCLLLAKKRPVQAVTFTYLFRKGGGAAFVPPARMAIFTHK